MKCFYHNDADGKCAGRMVYEYAIKEDGTGVEEYHPINYGMSFPFKNILPNEKIFIVDYSLPVDEMKKLLTITKDVTWIDHHKTAIERYKDFEYPIRGLRYDGIAGCMLTYCYLTQMTEDGLGEIKGFNKEMTLDAPIKVKLIADYDVWTFEYGNDTREFHLGFESHEFDPENENWEQYSVLELLREGRIIMSFRDNFAKEYCQSKGFETEFEGYKVFAMNLGLCGSDYFNSINDGSYDILMPFSFNGESWSYSMYSEKVDVSVIAKKYSGGGHAGAAGFSSHELLLRKEGENV